MTRPHAGQILRPEEFDGIVAALRLMVHWTREIVRRDRSSVMPMLLQQRRQVFLLRLATQNSSLMKHSVRPRQFSRFNRGCSRHGEVRIREEIIESKSTL